MIMDEVDNGVTLERRFIVILLLIIYEKKHRFKTFIQYFIIMACLLH